MHRLLFLKTVTPLHVGTGQSVGTTDLPIAREKATGWPVVPGSSVKGVLKDVARVDHLVASGIDRRSKEAGDRADEEIAYLFGSPRDDDAAAGALAITDLRCLLFPVRSYAGTFAYVTSETALERAGQLCDAAGRPRLPIAGAEGAEVRIAPASVLLHIMGQQTSVLLEDLDLTPQEDPRLRDLAEAIAPGIGLSADDLAKRLAVVSSAVFDFLTETATEVVTHVSLRFDTRVAREGFLRSEERVPSEAVFVGLATIDRLQRQGQALEAEKYLTSLNAKFGQFGGKASVGNGLCRIGVVA